MNKKVQIKFTICFSFWQILYSVQCTVYSVHKTPEAEKLALHIKKLIKIRERLISQQKLYILAKIITLKFVKTRTR